MPQLISSSYSDFCLEVQNFRVTLPSYFPKIGMSAARQTSLTSITTQGHFAILPDITYFNN